MKLLSNSLWNLLGGVVPAVAALVTVPLIVHRLGEVHYGTLTLIMSIVGYFALLDVNATAGSVKFLAEFRARDDLRSARQLFSLGLGLYAAIGLLGGAAMAWFAPFLVSRVFQVPAELQSVAALALRFGAVAFAFGQLQAYLQSVPQAAQRYDISARLEAVFGSLASVSTLVVVVLGGGLVEIMAARAAIAVANVALLLRVAFKAIPGLGFSRPERLVWQGLLSFSLYAYLSRFAAVTYANADKLLIGAFVSMRALSFYSVPFLLANRVFSLVFRLGAVLLPETSRLAAMQQTEQLRGTYFVAARYLVFLNTCLACLLMLFGRELLHYWAGAVFGPSAALILVLVAAAVMVDSLTNLPSLVNDGLGKPRNTGVFAAARALLGLAAAWVGVRWAGIEGVAMAQLLVSCLGALAFLVHVHRTTIPATLGEYWRHAVRPSALPFCLGLAAALGLYQRDPLGPLAAMGAGLALALILAAWGFGTVLHGHHRQALLNRVGLGQAPVA